MYKFVLVVFIYFFGFYNISLFAQNAHAIGITTEEEIRSQHPIFNLYANRYQPDSVSIHHIRQLKDSIHIVTVLGTWCKDSKKHVPSLFKVLEQSQNELITTTYVGVDYDNRESGRISGEYAIRVNPTFILFRNGMEIGRIEEEPKISIEQDIVSILEQAQRLNHKKN